MIDPELRKRLQQIAEYFKYLEEMKSINPEKYEGIWRELALEDEKSTLNERLANLKADTIYIHEKLIKSLPDFSSNLS